MPTDLLGIPQVLPQSRVLLAARYASVTISTVAESLYLECALPGKLWQPGLPMPLRDNRAGFALASPGVLGSTARVDILVWGLRTDDGVNATSLILRLGADLVMTQASGGASTAGFVYTCALIPGTSWKTITAHRVSFDGTANAFSLLRTAFTLTQGMDVTQSLAITASVIGGTSTITIDAAEVWLVSLLGFPPADSLLG